MMRSYLPLLLSLLVQSASAMTLVHEPFEYDAGAALNDLTGGSGFVAGTAGEWKDQDSNVSQQSKIATKGLSYPGLASSGLALSPTIGGLPDNRQFTTINGVTGVTHWVSFLIRHDSLTFNNTDIAWVSTSVSQGGHPAPAFGVFYDAATDKSVWGIGDSGPLGLTPTFSTVEFVPGETHLVVGSITWNITSGETETIRLYLNPSTTTAPDPSTAIAIRSLNIQALSANRIRYFITDSAGTSDSWLIDELRVSDSYGGVTPLPEPQTVTLLLGCGLYFLRRTYKKSTR